MKLSITYRAEYAYEKSVSLSPQAVRLFPRDVLYARIETLNFTTNSKATSHWRSDIFDNVLAHCFYPEVEDRLVFSLEATMAVQERNPFGFLLENRALELPVGYDVREEALLAAYFDGDSVALPAALQPVASLDTVNTLVAMNEWIHQNIAYERREEGMAFSPGETLRRGRGACRDTAVLLAAALRAQGLAARLASGYLWESMTDPAEKKAEGALHAWTEVYLPGAGWMAFDPSNGVLVDHHYLPAAVGRVSEDISPVSGHYYGDEIVSSSLAASLLIERL